MTNFFASTSSLLYFYFMDSHNSLVVFISQYTLYNESCKSFKTYNSFDIGSHNVSKTPLCQQSTYHTLLDQEPRKLEYHQVKQHILPLPLEVQPIEFLWLFITCHLVSVTGTCTIGIDPRVLTIISLSVCKPPFTEAPFCNFAFFVKSLCPTLRIYRRHEIKSIHDIYIVTSIFL